MCKHDVTNDTWCKFKQSKYIKRWCKEQARRTFEFRKHSAQIKRDDFLPQQVDLVEKQDDGSSLKALFRRNILEDGKRLGGAEQTKMMKKAKEWCA